MAGRLLPPQLDLRSACTLRLPMPLVSFSPDMSSIPAVVWCSVPLVGERAHARMCAPHLMSRRTRARGRPSAGPSASSAAAVGANTVQILVVKFPVAFVAWQQQGGPG